ncbi:hypothetical protein BU17DRAFT_71967 [Hysterangium stoloniferum]|nr:hypothetical protein BU17DRAFT_71967 [Hysterangium stoloniferum]
MASILKQFQFNVLKGVALEYIHRNLHLVGQQMLAVATSTTTSPPKDRLPRVLAAHCAPLPPSQSAYAYPYTASSSPAGAHPNPILPVIPLCVPEPASFPLLMHYLYTKRPDRLFAALLPAGASVATTFMVQAVLAHAASVHVLWSNVIAMGVFDDGLSKSVEMVWEVLVEALAISTGAQAEKVQAQL